MASRVLSILASSNALHTQRLLSNRLCDPVTGSVQSRDSRNKICDVEPFVYKIDSVDDDDKDGNENVS